ncbi:3096_t:CDS:2, partial [Gigaspora margarita]
MEVVKLNLKSKENNPLLHEVNRRVACAKQCIIITGAGISCSGEIPDFSSSDGLYSIIKCKYPGTFCLGKDLFDARLLRTNESIKAFNLFMGSLKELIINAKPTATHFFIKKLADMKKLRRVYTQNIDNLKKLVGLDVDWQFERVKNYQAQVVQLHGSLKNLQYNVCTNIFLLRRNIIVFSSKVERQIAPNMKRKAPHTIGQLKPTVILYGDSHPKGLEIGVKALIKNFARAIYGRGGFVILVNATDVVTKGWNGIIDYQIEGTCDEWVKLVNIELSNIKKITATRLSKKNSSIYIQEIVEDLFDEKCIIPYDPFKILGSTLESL